MSVLACDYATLESYFYTEIEDAQQRQGTALPVDVEAYVVHLLARYAERPQAAGRKSRALALEYLRARGEVGSARMVALRGVGDRALYISGVVPRSLARSPVDVRYVRGIGESAYREVADSTSVGVLGTLAEMFEEVSGVIGAVVELGPREDILTVYERWRRTGEDRDAKRLSASGVMLRDDDDVLQ